MDKIAVRYGIDIAKKVFAIRGVNAADKEVVSKVISRSKVLAYFADVPPAVIGIESCSGSHYWARELSKFGHEVRLINSRFVIPYRRKGKNDLNDAEAICEAVGRPGMRFVAHKSEEQQSILMAHRIRSQCVASRTALINQIHGHLLEFGVVVSKGRHKLRRDLHEVMGKDALPPIVEELLHGLLIALAKTDENIEQLDSMIAGWVKQSVVASRLLELDGVGPLTASAVAATVGDPRVFKNGRQMAAWLGLVPRQHSSGGRNRLGGITKSGDRYLRTLLVHGARAVLLMSRRGNARYQDWIDGLRSRRPDNVVVVAYAAKQARIMWAVMMGEQRVVC